mmetsp:Transcript_123568/g.275959  ORF Transcript_123568/g.275959 Transcript_123568/m.275959 type:complete len:277 (-) Transcript_123568:777-1607(-)
MSCQILGVRREPLAHNASSTSNIDTSKESSRRSSFTGIWRGSCRACCPPLSMEEMLAGENGFTPSFMGVAAASPLGGCAGGNFGAAICEEGSIVRGAPQPPTAPAPAPGGLALSMLARDMSIPPGLASVKLVWTAGGRLNFGGAAGTGPAGEDSTLCKLCIETCSRASPKPCTAVMTLLSLCIELPSPKPCTAVMMLLSLWRDIPSTKPPCEGAAFCLDLVAAPRVPLASELSSESPEIPELNRCTLVAGGSPAGGGAGGGGSNVVGVGAEDGVAC